MAGLALEPTREEQEAAIAACVQQFYAKAREDALLGLIFNEEVEDWDVHHRVVADFWSRALLGTDRYRGKPFVVHAHLPLELEHFDRWLALFEETAQATLPRHLAAKAIDKAHHVASSFRAGIFPFVGADGKPARQPG
jgi:hemoglobin